MKNTYKNTLAFIMLLLCAKVYAQKYYELLQQPSPNAYEVIAAYKEYYRTHEFVKNEKTRTYKNWLKLYQNRFTPDGTPVKPIDNRAQLAKIRQLRKSKSTTNTRLSASNPWKPIPLAVDRNECYSVGQNGVVKAVAMHPTQNSIVLVSGMGTGLWRSNDDGATWLDVIPNLPLVGMINHIVFAPSNPNIVYASASTGIIKSVDAGMTWIQTNLDWTSFFPNVNYAGDNYRSEFMYVDVHPTNSNFIIATNCSPGNLESKVSLSTDGGTTWKDGTSFGVYNFVHDLKFHPTDGNIVYALVQKGVNINFYRSTDGGFTFNASTNGYPNDYFTKWQERRAKLAVSPQTPDVLYLYYQDAELGATFYTSNDKGRTMNKICCGPTSEFMNKSSTERDFFGENNGAVQIRWATTLAASPTEANLVYAGTNIRPRVSKDGMKTWFWDGSFTSMTEQPKSNISPTSPDQCRSSIHGDIQDVALNGKKVWIANDGGLSFSDDGGINFVERADGLNVNNILGFDISHRNNVQTVALDHNGLLVRDDKLYNGKWKPFGGGDASGASINKIDDQWLYAVPSGSALIKRPTTSIHGHPSYSSLGNISIGSGYYSGYRNIQTHPTHFHTLVSTSIDDGEAIPAGVYRSKDNSKTWEVMKKFNGKTYYYGDVRISFANPKTMFAIERSEAGTFLWKTNDDGLTWSDVFPHNTNRDYFSAVRVALSDADTNKVWLATNSDNSATEQIMYSADGGKNWQNYSEGLPPFKIYSMEYQRGSNDGIYVGTEYGVYYRDASMKEWIPFGTKLPNIAPMYMHLDYSNEKIFVSTYRGLWENNFYQSGYIKAQISMNSASSSTDCEGDSIQFACFSAMKIDSNSRWEWTFEGGTPSSSTLERPVVKYKNSGKYSVTLKVSNGTQSSTQTLTDFITIQESKCDISCLPGKSLQITNLNFGIVQLPAIPALDSLTSFTVMSWVKPKNIQQNKSKILSTTQDFMGLYLTNSTNEIGYVWQNPNEIKNTGITIPANVWTHLSFVITSDSTHIYVNGNKHSFAERHTPFSLGAYLWQLSLIKHSESTEDYFFGEIDELRFYSRSLSDLQIKRAMSHIPSKLPADLVAYYQFNEESNTSAYDKVSRQMIAVPSKLTSTIEVSCSSPLQLQVRAFLQGTYINNTGMMSDTLRKIGVIPIVSPYIKTDSTTSHLLANNEVVDWILIELRSKSNPKNILYTQSALLLRNGNIISSKGLPQLDIEDVDADSFYVAIRHRNHLGVMTSTPLLFNSTTPTIVDFTKPSLATYKKVANGIPQLNYNGVTMLWAGNNTSSGEVKYSGSNNSIVRIYQSIINDNANIFKLITFVQKNTYKVEDVNLDGSVNYITDTVKLLSIILSHPNNIFGVGLFSFVEQLP